MFISILYFEFKPPTAKPFQARTFSISSSILSRSIQITQSIQRGVTSDCSVVCVFNTLAPSLVTKRLTAKSSLLKSRVVTIVCLLARPRSAAKDRKIASHFEEHNESDHVCFRLCCSVFFDCCCLCTKESHCPCCDSSVLALDDRHDGSSKRYGHMYVSTKILYRRS